MKQDARPTGPQPVLIPTQQALLQALEALTTDVTPLTDAEAQALYARALQKLPVGAGNATPDAPAGATAANETGPASATSAAATAAQAAGGEAFGKTPGAAATQAVDVAKAASPITPSTGAPSAGAPSGGVVKGGRRAWRRVAGIAAAVLVCVGAAGVVYTGLGGGRFDKSAAFTTDAAAPEAALAECPPDNAALARSAEGATDDAAVAYDLAPEEGEAVYLPLYAPENADQVQQQAETLAFTLDDASYTLTLLAVAPDADVQEALAFQNNTPVPAPGADSAEEKTVLGSSGGSAADGNTTGGSAASGADNGAGWTADGADSAASNGASSAANSGGASSSACVTSDGEDGRAAPAGQSPCAPTPDTVLTLPDGGSCYVYFYLTEDAALSATWTLDGMWYQLASSGADEDAFHRAVEASVTANWGR